MNINDNFRKNPYIFGRPILDKKNLYGRQDIVDRIRYNFDYDRKLTLLHVQRRIGKTSLITCLPQFFTKDQNGFQFVTFSFQGYKHEKISQILNYLADEIASTIVEGLPKQVRETADVPYNFFNIFLPKIIDEYLSGKKLVLLLDEFDVLEEDEKVTDAKGKKLFENLEKAVKEQEKLFAILVFGRPLKDMKYLEKFLKNLEKEGQKAIEVGLLEQEGTNNLIVEPAKGKLRYDENAKEAIWKLSAGHPSLTQLLCFCIFKYCRKNENKDVVDKDVDSILSRAMEEGYAVLQGFIKDLGKNENLFFRAVAEAQEIRIVNLGEINKKIIKPTEKISIPNLRQAGKRLEELGFLEKERKGYKIKVELVRLWLLKKHALLTEKKREHLMSQHGKNKPNRPNSFVVWMGFIVIIIILLLSGQNLFSRFHSSVNSERDPQDCYKLSEEIKKALKDKKDITNLEQIIDKVRDKWSREKGNLLDKQCPYNYKLDEKYDEILQYYGISQIGQKGSEKLERGIEALCEITSGYKDFPYIKKIFKKWVRKRGRLSDEITIKVFDKIIEQNQLENDCFAYSFKDDENKNELYNQKAQIHAKIYEYDQAVESYCQITENYYDVDTVREQLGKWLSSEFDQPYSTPKDVEKVEEKLKQLTKNKCPAFPPLLDN